jgi:exodeoxyribonuclease V gamma subunit
VSLSLHTSNRLVSLSAELAKLLAAFESSPLEAQIVVVSSLAIRRWLSLEIARLNGVCANVSFPFVADFISSLPRES